jgi:hypothetical protein
LTSHDRYTDDAIRVDQSAPYDYAPGPGFPPASGRPARQERPVPDSMRPLAAPLVLPATVTVWAHLDKGDPDPFYVRAVLDPDVNHGCTSAQFALSRQDGRGLGSIIVTVPGYPGEECGILLGCPSCGSPWARKFSIPRGMVTACEACGLRDVARM